jgi:hypothetical protein
VREHRLRDYSIDTAVFGREAKVRCHVSSDVVVHFAVDIEVVELELTRPRRDVRVCPLDARSDDVDPDVATGGSEDLSQFDRVAPDAAPELKTVCSGASGAYRSY